MFRSNCLVMFRSAILAMLLLLGPFACSRGQDQNALSSAEERGGRPDASWRTAALWDDGKAEFSVYEVTWRRYGNLYPGRVILVLVKEPWAPDLHVKADTPRANGFDVLKLNYVRDVPTGIYTYHQTASVYFRRDSAALVKLAATSSEACGVSTALLIDGRLETHSYFDGEGDRQQTFPSHAVPEDALPALLRDYVQGEPPPRLQVFPLLLMGRFHDLEATSFDVSKKSLDSLRVPAGSFAAVEITLGHGPTQLTYAFERAAPHRLLLYRHSDGTEYRLAKSERIAYWRMHDPGGEAWLPPDLRDHFGSLPESNPPESGGRSP